MISEVNCPDPEAPVILSISSFISHKSKSGRMLLKRERKTLAVAHPGALLRTSLRDLISKENFCFIIKITAILLYQLVK